MEFESRTQDGICHVTVGGSIDSLVVDDLSDRFAALFEDGQTHLAVDVGGVSYLCSGGAGVFLQNTDRAREAGGELVMVAPSNAFGSIMTILGIDSVYRTFATRKEAKEALKKGNEK